jgi:hypothetical protein
MVNKTVKKQPAPATFYFPNQCQKMYLQVPESDDIAFILSPPPSPEKRTRSAGKEEENNHTCPSIAETANLDYKLKNKRQRLEIVTLLEKEAKAEKDSVVILSVGSMGGDDHALTALLVVHSGENKEFERTVRERAVQSLESAIMKLKAKIVSPLFGFE